LRPHTAVRLLRWIGPFADCLICISFIQQADPRNRSRGICRSNMRHYNTHIIAATRCELVFERRASIGTGLDWALWCNHDQCREAATSKLGRGSGAQAAPLMSLFTDWSIEWPLRHTASPVCRLRSLSTRQICSNSGAAVQITQNAVKLAIL